VIAVHERTIVSIRDLRFATLHCPHCNTRVTLDFDAEYASGPHAPFTAPRECPRCANPFDSAIPPAVEAIRRAWKALAGLRDAVSFESQAEAVEEP
jgi:hypothetical protein